MEDSYKANDEEFKKLNNKDEPKEDENEEELEEEDEESQNKVNIYNKQDFTLNKIIEFFFKNEILATVHFCPICGKLMTLENNINYMDEKVWRCRSKLKKQDIKKIYGKNLSLNSLIYHYR